MPQFLLDYKANIFVFQKLKLEIFYFTQLMLHITI